MPIADAARAFLDVLLGVVLVAGWVALFAIWWFVFRGRDDQGNRRQR